MQDYKTIFSQRADRYHEAMRKWPTSRDEEFNAVIQCLAIKPDSVVADMPSGGGYSSRYLQGLVRRLIFLETADYFYQHCPVGEQYESYLCGLDAVPLPSQSIEYLFSLAGLHHITNRKAVYRECYRLLVNHGVCVIADADENSATARFLNEFVHSYNSMGHEGLFLNDCDVADMKDVGFKVESDQMVNYYWNFSNQSEMAEFCCLAFGLDLADQQQIVEGIGRYLGVKQQDDKVSMGWGLRFVRLLKSQ